jgi:serine/threonine protein kinase
MAPQTLPKAITDRYRIVQLIGSGGQGSAYRAESLVSGAIVAVKVLHQRLGDRSSVAQFEREVSALSQLREVEGVVDLLDSGVAAGVGWFATDLFSATLGDRLRSVGPLPAAEVAELAVRLAGTLEAVHGAGVVHRDLKPSNVFLRDDGSPVLGDFGIARRTDEATLTAGAGLTLGYVAPETVERGDTSEACDRYALGALLFALLEGHPPHAPADDVPVGVLVNRIGSGPPELSEANRHPLGAVVAELLSTEPSARPSLTEVQQRLADPAAATVVGSLNQVRVASSTGSAGGRLWHRAPRRLVVVGAAMALAGSLGVAAFAIDRSSGSQAEPPLSVPSTSTRASTASAALTSAAPTSAGPTAEVPNAQARADTSAQVGTIAPPTTPVPPATASPDSAVVLPDRCGNEVVVILCEPFDELLGWETRGDPAVAAIAQDDGVVTFTPGAGELAGDSYLERQLDPLTPDADLHVRMRVRVDAPPGADLSNWWQHLMVVADESQHTWSVGAQSRDGSYYLDLGFADPPDIFGGTVGESSVALDGWSCVEVHLPRRDSTGPRLLVDQAPLVEEADPAAAGYGNAFVVRVGPTWIDAIEAAPVVVFDEVVVSEAPLGC